MFGAVNCRVAIYGDNGNTPVGGALLAEGGPYVVAVTNNRKKEFAIGPIQLQEGLYWASLNFDVGGVIESQGVDFSWLNGPTPVGYQVAFPFGAFPNPMPGGGAIVQKLSQAHLAPARNF
jgi:hypothetical protein